MAHQAPNNPHLFESSSTSDLSSGPAQPSPVNTVSTSKASKTWGSTFAGLKPGFLNTQPSPATPEVVGTNAGGGTQEQRGQPQEVPPQGVWDFVCLPESWLSRLCGQNQTEPMPGVDDIAQASNNMSRLDGSTLNYINNAETALTSMRKLPDKYLKAFENFNEVVKTLSKLNPHVELALGILMGASKLLIRQANIDYAVSSLLETIRSVYEFLAEENTVKNVDNMENTLAKIACAINSSAKFIEDYSKTHSIWKRTGKHTFFDTQAIVEDYSKTLNALMQVYRDRVARDIQITVHHVLEELSLEGMAYAKGAGRIMTMVCLHGTRTKILRQIVDWIENPRDDAPRLMWLHGQAGRGKSAIAHTVASWAEGVGALGSCFCFARDRLSDRREEKILATIARDLADLDPAFRQALVDVISKKYSLKTTRDVRQQWQRFILEPLSKVNRVTSGKVVVVIDALDETESPKSRALILTLLASEAGQLPSNFRILLTSRLLPDIKEALVDRRHVTIASLDEVPAEDDIHLFVSDEFCNHHLKDIIGPEEIDQIARKSDGLFEWARLACDFIKGKTAGRTSKERFDDVIAVQDGPGGTLLDKTYTMVLESVMESSDKQTLGRFRSVMRQILSTLSPLPMSALQAMRNHYPNEAERYDVGAILEYMAPVLAGVSDLSPVRPLHASFYEFLMDDSRSGKYFIETSMPCVGLACASLQILCQELKFNICGLESSYFSNSEVSDLQERINEKIPPELSYSCQFWAQHLLETKFNAARAELVRSIVGSERMLFWLETLSIVGAFEKAIDALVCTATWLQKDQVASEDALRLVQDGIQFIRNFGSAISHSAPHLYISALPLAPSNTRLSKELIPKFCHLVGVPVGGLKEWGAVQLALEGHSEDVYSVAFSPDGKRVVSGSRDKTVRVWDVEKGVQIVSPPQRHSDWVTSVAFSPDGKRIVSGAHDHTVRIWDVESGIEIGSPLQGHTYGVKSVAFSPDGRRIVSGSLDNTMRVWDAERNVQIGNPLKGHDDCVYSVAFSPDGKRIASGSKDMTVRVWDTESGKQTGSLKEHDNWIQSVAFSPDGMRIVSGSADRIVRIWNAERGEQIGSPLQGHSNGVMTVAFSPDGGKIASGSYDCTVRVWNAKTGMQIGSPLQGHTHVVNSVAFSPDGKRIVSGSSDKTVRVWDVERGVQTGSPVQGHIGHILSIAFSPDGKRILSGSSDRTVRAWNAKKGVQIGSPLQGHRDKVQSVALSPDGKRIASGSLDMTVRVWDTEKDKQIVGSLRGDNDEVMPVALSPAVMSVAFSPDGKRIVSGSLDKTVRVWDAESGKQIGSPLQEHDKWVLSVAFSPDGKRIVSGSADETVRIWDAKTCVQMGSPLQGHSGWVYSVAFSPDGKKIVSGSQDKTVRVWDLGRGVHSDLEHTDWVRSVAFSPDGQRIISGSEDRTVRVWDAKRCVQLYCLAQGHSGPVPTVVFSPDGKRIASGSFDHTIRIWDTQTYEDMITEYHKLESSPHSPEAFIAGDLKAHPVCFSSVPSCALCDSEQLLDGFKPKNADDWCEPVKLHPDGWFRGPKGRLLLWLPPTFQRPFYANCNVAVIPHGCCTELDMSDMVHGVSGTSV